MIISSSVYNALPQQSSLQPSTNGVGRSWGVGSHQLVNTLKIIIVLTTNGKHCNDCCQLSANNNMIDVDDIDDRHDLSL